MLGRFHELLVLVLTAMSMVGAMARASSPTLAMRPSMDTRERPSEVTRRMATSSGWNAVVRLPAFNRVASGRPARKIVGSRKDRKRRRFTEPSRHGEGLPRRRGTAPLSARAPMSSFNAESSAVLPRARSLAREHGQPERRAPASPRGSAPGSQLGSRRSSRTSYSPFVPEPSSIAARGRAAEAGFAQSLKTA